MINTNLYIVAPKIIFFKIWYWCGHSQISVFPLGCAFTLMSLEV